MDPREHYDGTAYLQRSRTHQEHLHAPSPSPELPSLSQDTLPTISEQEGAQNNEDEFLSADEQSEASSSPDEGSSDDLNIGHRQQAHSAMVVSGLDFVYSSESLLDLHGALEHAFSVRATKANAEPNSFKETMKRSDWEL
jgi:hypothetical protein